MRSIKQHKNRRIRRRSRRVHVNLQQASRYPLIASTSWALQLLKPSLYYSFFALCTRNKVCVGIRFMYCSDRGFSCILFLLFPDCLCHELTLLIQFTQRRLCPSCVTIKWWWWWWWWWCYILFRDIKVTDKGYRTARGDRLGALLLSQTQRC